MTQQARWKNALWILAALAGAAAVYEGVEEARRARFLPDGAPAPEFSFARYTGGGQVTLADLKGKVVMLDFWATWCPPCVAEMPMLHRLAKELEAKGVSFVAADVADEDSKDAVDQFVSRVEPGLGPYVALSDPLTRAKYHVQAYPTLYIIDRQGKVVDALEGQQPELIVRHRIEKALTR